MKENIESQSYYAAKSNNIAEITKLAEENKNLFSVKPYGQGLLTHAALNGSTDVVKFLIDKGYPVNESDKNGFTAMHAAAEYNFTEIAKLLIAAKANVHVEDKKGNTPLSMAVFHHKGDIKIIDLLVKNGAKPLHKDMHGESPYEFAVRSENDEVIAYFKSKGFK